MAAMRVLQPKMKTLQERYKDDKPKLQQEMMKLYQQEKVNPARRLPADLPADPDLLRALQGADADDRDAAPALRRCGSRTCRRPIRCTSSICFGLLRLHAAELPGASACSPVILGITMWLQFKLNPAPMDEMQKQIFAIMPWMMMFVMAPFAARLAHLLEHVATS